jgi:hypothetical protein
MALLALLLVLLLGKVWSVALLPLRERRPRWAAWLVNVCLGAGLGIGITAVVYFLLRIAGAASASRLLPVELALAAAGSYLAWRAWRGEPRPAAESGIQFPLGWLTYIAFGMGIALVASGLVNSWISSPAGEIDALAGWNLRAKYLAAPGESWRNAVSPLLVEGQPAQPLLLPAAVARGWTYAGAAADGYSQWLQLLIALATAGLLTGVVALLRGAAAGCLAGLMLLGTHTWLIETNTQYPDLLLGLLMLGAFAALALDEGSRRAAVLAGILASLAAFTLNEGMVFLVALIAASAVFASRSRAVSVAAGAAPIALVTVCFHALLSPGGALKWSGLADGSRYWALAKTLATGILQLGGLFTHPLLMAAILFFVLRLDKRQWPFRRLAGYTLLASFVAGLLFLVMWPGSQPSAGWQALDRHLAEAAPSAVLLLFCWLRRPEDLAEVAVVNKKGAPQSTSRRSSA